MPGTAADENHSSSDDEELDFGMVIEESSNEKTPGDGKIRFIETPFPPSFTRLRTELKEIKMHEIIHHPQH